MKKEQQQKLKDRLEEIDKELENKDLTQEERETLGLHQAKIAGQLSSIWLPVGIIRKLMMLFFIIIAFLGFFTQYEWLVYSFLIAGSFSPKLVGLIAFWLGKMSNKS